MNRLMLCSGIHKREGWVTLDADPKNNPDVVWEIPGFPLSVRAARWAEIEWVHGITSFYPWEAMVILLDLQMILEPEGVLILEQPDYTKCTHNIAWVFGDPSHRNPRLMNRWAYTPRTLTEMLKASGFTRVELKPAQYHVPARDFRIEARP